ncbi:MAG: rod shape-determining protein MreC [Peptostreptococcaceae bacterium]|nr:rod shape-determining protein MreC [Peptostreptococcaceae bacterium]
MNKKWLKKKALKKIYIFSGIFLITLLILFFSIRGREGGFFSDFGLDMTGVLGSVLHQGKEGGERLVEKTLPINEKDRRIQELESEVEELRKELIRNKITDSELTQLQGLKSGLNYVEEDYEKNYIAASIVAKNDGNYYTSFTISAGREQGVQKDSIVLTGKGLIGIVHEVSENYCKAISVLNSKSSVSFELLKNSGYTGIASQNIHIGEEDGKEQYINGYMFDINYRVLPGDIVITSGLGLYPKGIPLGVVNEVIEDKSSLQNFVRILPYVNFKKLDKVMILNPRELR